MSLYNIVCGNNPLFQLYLAILSGEKKITLPDIPRFRDVYVKTEPEPRIVIYTRTGGGNRQDYETENSALADHPLFITDHDDDFDSTFAHWEYRIPERFTARVVELQGLLAGLSKFATPREKFDRVMASAEGREAPAESLSDEASEKIHKLIQELVIDSK